MPMCPKCGEKWDLSEGFDACPNCEGGDRAIYSKRLQLLFWAAGGLILAAVLVATTCTH